METGGLPKSLPPAAPFDGRLTSDLHKWLQDSPSGLRLIAAVTPIAPECKLWRPESSSLSVGSEVWIPPGPHGITFILLSSSATFTGFILKENEQLGFLVSLVFLWSVALMYGKVASSVVPPTFLPVFLPSFLPSLKVKLFMYLLTKSWEKNKINQI